MIIAAIAPDAEGQPGTSRLPLARVFRSPGIAATVLWGIMFGGAAAQLQAALTTTGGADSDVANSFLPVAFNLAIFTAGILGAALLTNFSGLVLAVVMIVAGLAALMLTIYGLRTAFPARL